MQNFYEIKKPFEKVETAKWVENVQNCGILYVLAIKKANLGL